MRSAGVFACLVLLSISQPVFAGNKQDGKKCNKDSQCDAGLVCEAAVCESGCHIGRTFYGANQTNPANSCQSCQPALSTTRWTNVAVGTACNDGNACTQVDTCQSGACVGSNPVICTAADQCHQAGACSSATGVCSNPAKVDGSACNDGNACTQADACQSGACVGSSPVVCAAADQCHQAGSCSTATGACSNPAKADGSACNDGSACTLVDVCESGACVGLRPVVCSASDQCHQAGACDSGTGVCSNPAKADGSACNDGNACTQADACQSGACVGANPVVCTASDQCHDAGTCNPATGCSNPAKTDGSACNDGNACTQADACQSGACVGSNPVVCSASDQCHFAGACNSVTGVCSNPEKFFPSPCDDGNACTQEDVCANGKCVGLNFKPDGSACDDGNACTQTDACQSGACVGSNPVVCGTTFVICTDPGCGACVSDADCTAVGSLCVSTVCSRPSDPSNQCHQAGTCDSTTGACASLAWPDGIACSDGNLCTDGDTCQSGNCIGGPAVAGCSDSVCSKAGDVACVSGNTCCGLNQCANLLSDPQHCGACSSDCGTYLISATACTDDAGCGSCANDGDCASAGLNSKCVEGTCGKCGGDDRPPGLCSRLVATGNCANGSCLNAVCQMPSVADLANASQKGISSLSFEHANCVSGGLPCPSECAAYVTNYRTDLPSDTRFCVVACSGDVDCGAGDRCANGFCCAEGTACVGGAGGTCQPASIQKIAAGGAVSYFTASPSDFSPLHGVGVLRSGADVFGSFVNDSVAAPGFVHASGSAYANVRASGTTSGVGPEPFDASAFNTGPVGPAVDTAVSSTDSWQVYYGNFVAGACHDGEICKLTNSTTSRVAWCNQPCAAGMCMPPLTCVNASERITAIALAQIPVAPGVFHRSLIVAHGTTLSVLDLVGGVPPQRDLDLTTIYVPIIANGESTPTAILSIAAVPFGDVLIEVRGTGVTPNRFLLNVDTRDFSVRNELTVQRILQHTQNPVNPVPANFGPFDGRLSVTPDGNLLRFVPSADNLPATGWSYYKISK